jgi:regulator of sigma D
VDLKNKPQKLQRRTARPVLKSDAASVLKQLGADLSRLGEHLTTRIELEDQLISAMLDGEPVPGTKA